MVKVSVESKTDLLDLSTSAKIASEQYKQATASAYRSFQMRTSGGGGSALDVFIAKINTLSDQVFQHYPQLLKDYATALETYASSLEAEGFSGDLIYSKKDDIDGIVNWLTKQRYNSIDEKGAALDTVFKQAVTALAASPAPVELGAVTTVSIVQEAHDTLNRLGKERVSKHGNLTDALKQFKKELESIEVSLMTTQSHLENAHYIGYASVKKMVGWLTSGTLNAGNMNLLDHIRGKGDGDMLHVLLNEGENKEDFFKKLGDVDATHVSQGMMTLAYKQFFDNAFDGAKPNTERLQVFFEQLDEQDRQKVKIYMEKMAIAAHSAATLTTLNILEDLDDSLKGKDFDAYQKKLQELSDDGTLREAQEFLAKNGQLNALFESVYISGLGKGRNSSNYPDQYRFSKLTLNGNGSFEWTRDYFVRELKTNKSDSLEGQHILSENTLRTKKIQAELSALHGKRLEASGKLLKDLTLAGVGASSPELEALMSFAFDASSAGSISDHISLTNQAGELVFDKRYPEQLKRVSSGLGSFASFIEDFQAISEQETRLKEEGQGILFDTGGIAAVPTKGDTKVSYDMTYDLQAQLQAYDMRKNGLRFYVYREGNLKQFDSALTSLQTRTWTDNAWEEFLDRMNFSGNTTDRRDMYENARQLLAGQGGQMISEVGEGEVLHALGVIDKNPSRYGFEKGPGWQDNYLETNTAYFENLVGYRP